jgi:hypothetical protein
VTKLELILLCSNFIFVILWLWQAVLLARTTRALKVANTVSASVLLVINEYKLAYATVEQMKIQCESTKSLLEATTILGDRMSAYNERLNHLTTAVRTKIERFDKTSLKV